MKSSRKISFLLVLAMGLTLSPVPLTAANDVTVNSGADPCSEVNPISAGNSCETSQSHACADSACGSAPSSDDDKCCQSGCDHCSLPCCSGTVMLLATGQGHDPALTAADFLAAPPATTPWVDVDPPDHPPGA